MARKRNNKKIDYKVLMIIGIISMVAIIGLISSIISIVSLSNHTYSPIINWGNSGDDSDEKEENKENREVNELIKKSVKSYVDTVYYADIDNKEFIPDFDGIEKLPNYYLIDVVIKAISNPESKFYLDPAVSTSFTYEKMNEIIVEKFGNKANMILPQKFENLNIEYNDETNTYSIIGHGYSENKSRTYVLDSFFEKDDKIYVDMYEYYKEITDSEGKLLDLSVLDNPDSEKSTYYYQIASLGDVVLKKYNYVVSKEENITNYLIMDESEKEATPEEMEKVVIENKDKLLKRRLEISYDNEKDLYYLVSSKIISSEE